MKKNYLLSFLLVFIIHFIFHVFWIITTKPSAKFFAVNVTLTELITDIILPLVILISLFLKGINKRWYIFEIIFSLILGLFGSFFHYFNWGASTRNFFTPDSETVWLFAAIFEINLFSITILGIIFQIILLIKNRKN